jgi:hypothetical protein
MSRADLAWRPCVRRSPTPLTFVCPKHIYVAFNFTVASHVHIHPRVHRSNQAIARFQEAPDPSQRHITSTRPTTRQSCIGRDPQTLIRAALGSLLPPLSTRPRSAPHKVSKLVYRFGLAVCDAAGGLAAAIWGRWPGLAKTRGPHAAQQGPHRTQGDLHCGPIGQSQSHISLTGTLAPLGRRRIAGKSSTRRANEDSARSTTIGRSTESPAPLTWSPAAPGMSS